MEDLLDCVEQGGQKGLVGEEFEEVAEEGYECHGGDDGGGGGRCAGLLSELGISNTYAGMSPPCNLNFYERRDPRQFILRKSDICPIG